MKFVVPGLIACLLVSYPFIVFFGLNVMPMSYLGGFFVLLALVRLVFIKSTNKPTPIQPMLTVLLLMVGLHAVFSNDPAGLRIYPVAVNAILLMIFAISLFEEKTVIERLARITEPDLPPSGVRYTRKVTIVWCVFFLLNGLAALYTVLFADMKVWTLYNGVIAYLLMGLLFLGEWIVRLRVRRAFDVESP